MLSRNGQCSTFFSLSCPAFFLFSAAAIFHIIHGDMILPILSPACAGLEQWVPRAGGNPWGVNMKAGQINETVCEECRSGAPCVAFIHHSLSSLPPAFHKRATPEDWLNDIRYEHTAPERVRSIDDNSDALLWRLRLIEEAKERIILTTFDFWDEESGQDVIGALWAAAERGVRVQVLLDGINGLDISFP